MRAFSRIGLVLVLAALSSPLLLAEHLQGDCPLTRAGTTVSTAAFDGSPHGIARSGNSVFTLRGQTLTTYTVNALGELQVARQDVLATMRARDSKGGVAFSGDTLFLSGEGGLEIWNLAPARAGTGVPTLHSRTPGLHFNQLAVSGNTLAGLFPLGDMPCYPMTAGSLQCATRIELFNVATLATPTRAGSIVSSDSTVHRGFNDIAFVRGFLVAASEGSGVHTYSISNPAAPVLLSSMSGPASWLDASGGTSLVAGDDLTLHYLTVSSTGVLGRDAIFTIPQYLSIERGLPLAFHRQAWIDETNRRIITLINERDPLTLEPARTVAFDVFDLGERPEGAVERLYENVSVLTDDEVKYDPVVVGPYVYVTGTQTGVQAWGACGEMAGQIEFDSIYQLGCGGAELHGWVTGSQKITGVELFLGSSSLGPATFAPVLRTDISSRTPVLTWRIPVNLDETPRGERLIRAVGTDVAGNRRQFSSVPVFFPGPGSNCSARRRAISGRR